jgi:putative transposase
MTTARSIADAAAAKRRNLKARHGSAGERVAGTNRVPKGRHHGAHVPECSHPLVFSTKPRRNTIPGELQEKLSMYFVGIGKGHELPVLCARGTANHSHLLISLPTRVSLAKAVQVLKANSSRWLGEHGLDFAWQDGYGAFSVSSSDVEVVKHYIEHQAEHHAKHSFEDEFVSLLRKSGVLYDPQFVFG